MRLRRIPYEIDVFKFVSHEEMGEKEEKVLEVASALIFPKDAICGLCGVRMGDHAQIKDSYRTENAGFIVCPGDYVARDTSTDGAPTGKLFRVDGKYIETHFEEIKP